MDYLVNVLAPTTSLKSHLAEPVLTAVVREHPDSELALRLLATILPKAQLKVSFLVISPAIPYLTGVY